MTTPLEILQNAKSILAAASGSSAARRAAISRAYYSVFHFLGMKYDPDGYNTEGKSHQRLLQTIFAISTATTDATAKSAKLNINSLVAARIDADYNLASAIELTDAQIAVWRAEQIFAGKA